MRLDVLFETMWHAIIVNFSFGNSLYQDDRIVPFVIIYWFTHALDSFTDFHRFTNWKGKKDRDRETHSAQTDISNIDTYNHMQNTCGDKSFTTLFLTLNILLTSWNTKKCFLIDIVMELISCDVFFVFFNQSVFVTLASVTIYCFFYAILTLLWPICFLTIGRWTYTQRKIMFWYSFISSRKK